MKKGTVIVRLLVFLLILIVVNMISSKLYFRLDFTADDRYTLSKATTDVLTELEDVVTVKAYFSDDLPTQLISNRQDFEDLLLEYENRSGGNVIYEFISPNDDEEKEQEAQQNGIQPIIVNVTEKDQVQQLRAYMGAVITFGDQKEVIAVVQPGVNMEYNLTTSIKKLTVLEKPTVAFLEGHGEATMQQMPQLVQQLSVLSNVESYTISTEEIPSTFKSLIIIDPKDTIPPSDFIKIDDFMSKGGNVYLAYSNLNGDLSTSYLSAGNDIGVMNWLSRMGIRMGSQFVIDANCGAVSVRQNNGVFTYSSQVQFPYFPNINTFGDHPAVKGLEGILLPFASRLDYSASDSLIQFTPLMQTSDKSGLAVTPSYIDIQKKWNDGDFNQGNQTVALALDGPLSGTINSRIVVVTNGKFAVNGDQPQQIAADNVNFTSNSIDWLSDDTGLIDLRTKGITSRPLEKVEDNTREMLKWGNVLIPILLILIYALIRRQRNVRKRHAWMEGNY
jgi:gliding-associated putative ABC transporter substrate-binding component GldG